MGSAEPDLRLACEPRASAQNLPAGRGCSWSARPKTGTCRFEGRSWPGPHPPPAHPLHPSPHHRGLEAALPWLRPAYCGQALDYFKNPLAFSTRRAAAANPLRYLLCGAAA